MGSGAYGPSGSRAEPWPSSLSTHISHQIAGLRKKTPHFATRPACAPCPASDTANPMKPPLDKRMTLDTIVAELKNGMTLGVGGWATRRKPMALVRAIVRAGLKDLNLVAPYGGPDVGMLAAAGAIRKLTFAFVSLDHIPIEPHFKTARQA